MANSDVLGTITFHDVETGYLAKLRLEKEITNDYYVNIPVDLLYNGIHSVDDQDGVPSVTLLTREELAAVLKDMDRRISEGWKEYVEKQILGNNDLTWVPQNGNGYIRQLHDLLREEARIREEEDNEIKCGERTPDPLEWNPVSSNLNQLRHDINSNDEDIYNLNRYTVPIGSIIPSVTSYIDHERCFVELNGTTIYAGTYSRLFDAVQADSDELHFIEDVSLNNIDSVYQELMQATYSGFTSTSNTPSRMFMNTNDLVKILGGNTGRAKVRNADGDQYRIAYAGNTNILKNIAREYYLRKYGNDSQYVATYRRVFGNGVNNIYINVDRNGNLKYRTNMDTTFTNLDINNIDDRSGYLQIVTIKNGDRIAGEYAYIKRDNGNCNNVSLNLKVVSRTKDLEEFRSVENQDEELVQVETLGINDVTIEMVAMPLTNKLSPLCGRAYTTLNMSDEGIFLGGGNGDNSLLDWTIPQITGRISTPYKNWYVCDGVFNPAGSTYFNSRDGGGDPTFIGNFNLNNVVAYRGHYNTQGKFYPKHYSVKWFMKVDEVL